MAPEKLPEMRRPLLRVTHAGTKVEFPVPKGGTVSIRQSGESGELTATRVNDAGQPVFEVNRDQVFVTRPTSQTRPIPLSTNAYSLPGTIAVVTDEATIEGYIEIAIQSGELVPTGNAGMYGGALDVCFRLQEYSENAADAAKTRFLPLVLLMRTTSGLTLDTNRVTITDVGNAGCVTVPIQCSSGSQESVKVISDELGEQEFTVTLDDPRLAGKVLMVIAGMGLGALGGLVRTWQSHTSRKPWKRVAGGAFCGLVLVLLGPVGVKILFGVENAVTRSVILGFCGVLGYLGVQTFEKFSPKK